MPRQKGSKIQNLYFAAHFELDQKGGKIQSKQRCDKTGYSVQFEFCRVFFAIHQNGGKIQSKQLCDKTGYSVNFAAFFTTYQKKATKFKVNNVEFEFSRGFSF